MWHHTFRSPVCISIQSISGCVLYWCHQDMHLIGEIHWITLIKKINWMDNIKIIKTWKNIGVVHSWASNSRCFEGMLGTTHPMTVCHISEDLSPQPVFVTPCKMYYWNIVNCQNASCVLCCHTLSLKSNSKKVPGILCEFQCKNSVTNSRLCPFIIIIHYCIN
jgi:hypothetical protein